MHLSHEQRERKMKNTTRFQRASSDTHGEKESHWKSDLIFRAVQLDRSPCNIGYYYCEQFAEMGQRE